MTTPNQRTNRKRNRSNHQKGKRQNDESKRQPTATNPVSAQRPNLRRARSSAAANESNLVQDIEEQLKRQRLKRQEQESATSGNSSAPTPSSDNQHRPKQVLGPYEYDEERQAYFPKSKSSTRPSSFQNAETSSSDPDTSTVASSSMRAWSRFLPQQQQIRGDRHSITSVRVPSLLCALQSCSDRSSRVQIRSLCVGRCLRDGMEIVPNVTTTISTLSNGERKERWWTLLNSHPPLLDTTAPSSSAAAPNPGRSARIDNDHPSASSSTTTTTTTTEMPTIPLDLRLKTQLHPSARTFDVIAPNPTQSHELPTVASICSFGVFYAPSRGYENLMEPEEATAETQSELLAMQRAAQDAQCHWNFQLLRAFQNTNKEFGFLSLVESKAQNDVKAVRFYRHYEDSADRYTVERNVAALWYYSGPIYDVAFMPFSNRLVCAPGRRSDTTPLRPCCVDVGQLSPQQPVDFGSSSSRGTSRLTTVSSSTTTSRFPQSDALCVETSPNNPNVVVYGHRNGQVSLVDFRTLRECEMTTMGPTCCDKETVSLFGSTTRLLIPQHDPHWIVARGSMGATRLYDVRRGLSGNSSRIKGRRSHSDDHHVLEFRVSPEYIHPSLTSRCCNGLALDPRGEVIIAPYMDQKEEPYFGLWSLRSGQLVATKHISASNKTDDPQPNYANTLPYCELCSTPTSGWSWNEKDDDDDMERDEMAFDSFRITQPKGRWGLWFKFGRPLVQRTTGDSLPPPSTGSIHHVSFHGRLVDNV